MNERALLAAALVANMLWTIALVAAPLSLEPATVTELDGHANVVDHASLWAGLPTFPRLVYTLGDLVCHQMGSRSWDLGGNQLPVDVRMLSAFIAANVGFLLALSRPALWSYRDAALQVLPAGVRARLDSPRRRVVAVSLSWCVAVLPALLDVAAQVAFPYESTNTKRLLTGALMGGLGGFLLGAFLRSLMASRPPAVSGAAAPQ